MDENGLIFREDVIDVKYVEEMYITPKNFHYQMSRYSDEKWEQEQKAEDKDTAIITLDTMERGVDGNDILKMKANEKTPISGSTISDIDLCNVIDTQYVPRYLKDAETPSIYLLRDRQRTDIANLLYQRIKSGRLVNKDGETVFYPSLNQIRRCAALKYTNPKTVF